jgi:hypothetical protein
VDIEFREIYFGLKYEEKEEKTFNKKYASNNIISVDEFEKEAH